MTGAPTPDPFTERQMQAIASLVDAEINRISTAGRLARGENVRNVRLAKTVSRDGSYPTSGDTFAVRFVDCGFTPVEPGSSTMTCSDRTEEGDTDDADDVIAREINGDYVEEGTYVFAMWQRGVEGDPDDYGEWWIV
jgi:hypothetical protein